MDSDSSEGYSYKYDVFISFRGPDTRNTFVDHLYAHLTRKGISTFKDDKSLQKGESISPQLLQAIKDSRVSIVVFSKDYASSTWCLDEMAAIDESCRRLKQVVFPVFYDIDPSHVRKQSGVYEDAFVLHAELFKHDPDKVSEWKRAMTSLAGSAGWDVRNKPEFEEIEQIVEAVIKKLGHKFSGSADDLIGIQPRVEALESLLKLSSKDDGLQVLGIWGMDGIGKTTLATVLYDRISYQFDACCYIENVCKVYEDGGAIALQKQILCQTIQEKILDTYSPSEIARIVRYRLQHIKLLVVLDNVDQIEQLHDLDIKRVLLHPESRLIIITRDRHILRAYGCIVYEVELMNDDEAHKLLCRKAFVSDYSSSTFSELIPEVLKYTQGLPLAIRVIGSFLHSRNAKQWRATLDRWKNSPPDKILKVLQVSYEGLEEEDKEIFLHVACFFKGERKDYVSRVLDACELHPDIGIPLLAEKSLITIKNEEIHMHELLQDLGKKIVREKHPDEPGFWSRLWLYGDFHHVMMTEKKAIEAEAIILNLKEDDFEFNELRAEDLPRMERLKLLILNHKIFSGRPLFLSNSLRYLLWNGYPFISLPSNFQPCRIVELNMPHSSIEQLWTDIQQLPCLKRMDLSNSKNLKMTPCFKGMQKLERLDFSGCISLYYVHPSIGLLRELQFLSLQNCTSLVCFEFGRVSKSSSLRVLCLSGCTNLVNTPDFKGLLNLEYLDMDQCTSLYTVDKSIGDLTKLRFLSLRGCTNLVRIPDSFNNMSSLMTLDLCGCSRFTNLPLGSISSSHTQESLISLDLSFCNISIVPDAIGELRGLERLNLQGNNFIELPSTIKRLSSLAYLNLSHCHRLQIWPLIPIGSGPSDSVGRYFKTKSGSRDHRSGLYVFDCPKLEKEYKGHFLSKWLLRLVKEPRHFRCGFDIILSWPWLNTPDWFDYRFNRGSIIRIKESVMHVDWIGFVFCIVFEVSNHSEVSDSSHQSLSSPMPHPFYLSFESEQTEERFDMPLNLERNMVDGKGYLWTIYVSREHCHFVNTGAQITFKARHGLVIKEWGLNVITRKNISVSMFNFERWPKMFKTGVGHPLEIVGVKQSSSSNEPKIQLPYNWFVSDEDQAGKDEEKGKGTYLFDLDIFTNLPLGFFNCSLLKNLISLDLSFCNIYEVPCSIGELRCLERLNLQGNNFVAIPSTIVRLLSLAYLNLSHCHSLEYLPNLPTESAPSLGRYFKTTSGSRDHRSGLYVFDCPKVAERLFPCKEGCNNDVIADIQFEWIQRLVKEPRHFRCGFDIVLPWHWANMGCHEYPIPTIPNWFDHRFNGCIRIRNHYALNLYGVGFVFCVAFEVNKCSEVSGSHQSPSSPLPYPFYLSFESENTEERFDMPLNLELNEIHSSKCLWIIYISWEHCHFVHTGALITFKARQNLIMKECGLRVVTEEDIEASEWKPRTDLPFPILEMEESISDSFEPKIQLPYNWLVSVEECVENDTAKGKETGLFNLGLFTESPH